MSNKDWNYTVGELDPDQLSEIEAGEKAGLDVSLYAHKEYLAIQMREIRKGLKAGLDVSVYAKPDYDWFQMKEIRKGLQKNLDIKKFSSPNITYDRMRQIRKGLQEGLDLSRYAKLDAAVLRQLRKASASKINIIEYVKKGYIAEQLEEIRVAMKKGLDIEPYLSNEYRGVAIHEICVGLEHGVDVSRYAEIDYSWQQMREIRLGLEGRLDTALYENPLYSAGQMKEIRMGLEAGLDVKEYQSLMYTATDMKRFRMKMLEELAMATVESSRETVLYQEFLISVSSDGMEVYMEIHAEQDKTFRRKDLEEALKQKGIVYGILYNELDRMIRDKIYNRGVLVAKGMLPEKGKDGWYEYSFSSEEIGKPKLLEDGSVDYQSVQWFVMVEEGQKLAIYHEPTEGISGWTVRGVELKTTRGKERKILTGKGFIQLYDKKTYVAAYGGKVDLDEEKNELLISKVCVLDDVTQVTGNIDFDGCVYIKGDVGRGAVIRATEDIVIDGGVEAANIRSGGSVLLRQGMNGIGKGHISAEKNVEGKFFEAVSIDAEDIRANYCLNCSINARGGVVISGSKGVLAGGIIQTVKGLESHRLGNRVQISTFVRLGINDRILKEQHKIEEKVKSVQKELTVLGHAHMKYQRTYPPEVRNAMEIFIKIENAIYTKELEQEALYKKKLQIEESVRNMKGAKAVVHGRVYEGVTVEIDKLRWIATETKNVTIRRSNNRIVVYSNL